MTFVAVRGQRCLTIVEKYEKSIGDTKTVKKQEIKRQKKNNLCTTMATVHVFNFIFIFLSPNLVMCTGLYGTSILATSPSVTSSRIWIVYTTRTLATAGVERRCAAMKFHNNDDARPQNQTNKQTNKKRDGDFTFATHRS